MESRVAVVGLGAMGSRIAGRLLETGHEVVVWNRTAAKCAPLVEAGALAAATPAEAARRAGVVLTLVADPAALAAVTELSEGILATAGAGTTLIEMSTVGPAAIERLALRLPAGVRLLDAPVLGSVAEAERGELTLFVGGGEALVERWLPLLRQFGRPLHVGPLGAGAAAKLVANSTLFGVLGVLGEAVALGSALGLSSDAAYDVLAATPLAAQAARRRQSIESGAYPKRFGLSLARKDANLILDAAAACGCDLHVAAAAQAWLADAEDAGLGELDYTAVIGHIAPALTNPRPFSLPPHD